MGTYKDNSNYNKNHIVILSISTIVLFIYLFAFNFQLNDYIGTVIHYAFETIIGTFGICIFFAIAYAYSFNRNLQHIITGSLILSTSLFGIYNTLYVAIDKEIIYTQVIYFGINISICLSLLIMTLKRLEKIVIKKTHYIMIPLMSIMIGFTFLFYIINFGIPEWIVYTFENHHTDLYFILLIIFVLIMILAINNFIENNTITTRYVFYAVYFNFIAMICFSFNIDENDLFSISAHILNLLGFSSLFKLFMVKNYQMPYLQMAETRHLALEASKIKTDFLINLSHELRTPVNVVLSALRLVNKNHGSTLPIVAIEKNTLRINKLCENILAFNNIEHGLSEISYSREDIVFIIDEILEEADTVADSKHLDIKFINTGKHTAVTDIDKLVIVLLNLISNSLKYCPSGGTVEVILHIEDNIEIEIYNNGPEILPKDTDKIFDKFYKSDDNRLVSTEGLGIGLYISKKYTELLGGNISIINSRNGTGFKLVIPQGVETMSHMPLKTYTVQGFFSDICE